VASRLLFFKKWERERERDRLRIKRREFIGAGLVGLDFGIGIWTRL